MSGVAGQRLPAGEHATAGQRESADQPVSTGQRTSSDERAATDKHKPAGIAALAWMLPWLLLFVAHRMLLAREGFDGVFFWEESYRLVVAEALRSGWNIPLHDLQADPYNGGSLVFSALAALAGMAVTPSLLMLKAVAVGWNALGLALWMRLAERVAGRTTAHLLAACWITAPPVFAVFNMVALGSHGDTIPMAALQWLLMLRYVDDPARSPARLAAWAAAAGLGCWFGYVTAVPVAAAAAWAWACGALPLRAWPVAAGAFLAGVSPWIAYSAASGGTLEVLRVTFAGSTAAASRGYLATLADLVAHGVPVALYFRDAASATLPREVPAYGWLALYSAAFASLLPSLARGMRAPAPDSGATASVTSLRARVAACPELPLLALFPLFLMLVAASNQEFNDYGAVRWVTFRILVPALPSALFALALALARAPRMLRAFGLLVLLGAGALGSAQIEGDGHADRSAWEADARGLGAEAMGHLLVFKHGADPAGTTAIEAMPAELRERAWRGVGFSYAYLFGTRRAEAPASALTAALLAVPQPWRGAALEGARLALTAGMAQVVPLPPGPRRDELADAVAAVAAGPTPDRPFADMACRQPAMPYPRRA